MKKIQQILWLTIVLLAITFFQSCKKDENPIIPSEETVKIPTTTKYITSADYTNYFEGYSTDSTQLIFKKDVNSKYNLATNDIIAFSEGAGLLRKVTGIQTTNTQLIVNTSQGTLEDAIENGTIEYSGPLSKKNLLKVEILTDGIEYNRILNKTNETQYDFNIVNKVLYDADNNLSTTNDQIRLNGTFSFTSDIFVKILVKNFKLQYAKYGFEANNSESLTLDAMIQYNLSKEIEIARLTMTPITVQVGILPVIIVPDLRIKIGVSGYANAGISTSIQNEFHFEAGSEFIIGTGWQPYKTFTNNFNYNPPSLTANCGARAYIKPEINMAVYGVLAGYGYGEAYGKLEADLLQNPWWKLYVGYKLGIGARAEILGHGLFDFVLDALIQQEQLIAQASLPSGDITSVQLTGSQAIAKDIGGNTLWTYSAPSTILCYELFDIDKDGKTEVLLGTDQVSKGQIICVENNGTKAWDYQTGATGVYWPDDSFNCWDIDVADVDNDGAIEIVTLSQESPWYPQRICVLSNSGALEGDYWHPGYGQCDEDNLIVEDLNSDGVFEIIVGSHNNDLGGIEVLFLLEGNNVHGQAPPYLGNGEPNGTEKWYKQNLSNPVNKIEVVNDRNTDNWKDLKITMTDASIIYVSGKTGDTIQ